MFNVGQNNTNNSIGGANGGFVSSNGVYNQFATPEIDDGKSTKRDTVKVFLFSVLVLTILLAFAAYFYASYLDSQVEAKKASLSNLDNNQNIVTFEENLPKMRALSQKLKLLNSVNNNRIYISGMLLPLLESVVESSKTSYVYFSRMDLKQDSSNSVSISLAGTAQDYLALSRQITNFKSGPLSNYFTNFKFISLSLGSGGEVSFNISFNVNISANAYLDFLKNTNNNITSKQNTSGTLFKANSPATVFSATSTNVSSSTSATTSKSKVN